MGGRLTIGEQSTDWTLGGEKRPQNRRNPYGFRGKISSRALKCWTTATSLEVFQDQLAIEGRHDEKVCIGLVRSFRIFDFGRF